MGSAALFHCARAGASVLGIDALAPPHTLGSSHGETRVIREAYFEHPAYVPLVQRAYELWAELESLSGDALYLRTGGLMIGARDSTVARGAILSAREHNLPHEVLTAEEIHSRHPALCPSPDMIGVLEPRAGILYPEKCISAHLDQAGIAGASVLLNCKMERWHPRAGKFLVETSAGSFTAKSLVVAAGPWIKTIVPELDAHLQVERQVLAWFQSLAPHLFSPANLPIHLWEYEPGKMFYGFPDLGDGVKVALHHQGRPADPESVDRTVGEDDILQLSELLERFLPQANGRFMRGTVCLYTNTADGHFIIDRHPEHKNLILASPCSGHGFKFASAVGEELARLALNPGTPPAIPLFQLSRLHQ